MYSKLTTTEVLLSPNFMHCSDEVEQFHFSGNSWIILRFLWWLSFVMLGIKDCVKSCLFWRKILCQRNISWSFICCYTCSSLKAFEYLFTRKECFSCTVHVVCVSSLMSLTPQGSSCRINWQSVSQLILLFLSRVSSRVFCQDLLLKEEEARFPNISVVCSCLVFDDNKSVKDMWWSKTWTSLANKRKKINQSLHERLWVCLDFVTCLLSLHRRLYTPHGGVSDHNRSLWQRRHWLLSCLVCLISRLR